MDAKTYQVYRSTITLRIGDICTSRAEVLVSSDDYHLSMGGGVSRALGVAAGPEIRHDVRKMIPARAGDIVVTTAGKLPARYIFHAITIGTWQQDIPDDVIVRQATHRAMQLLPMLNCRSIAFPAIGAGAARIPLMVVASQMAGVLVGSLLDSAESLAVEVYLLDPRGRLMPEEIFAQFESDIGKTLGLHLEQRAGNVLSPPAEPARPAKTDLDPESRLQQIYEMLRHLDSQRNQAEAVLIHELTAGGSGKLLSKLRGQLEEIRELRRGYELDLEALTAPASSTPDAIFLSSTWTDLQSYRQRLKDLIQKLAFRFIGMEDFNPAKEPPGVYIRRRVNEAGIYLGVFGMRYGSIDPGSGMSMTELEYRQAVASRKELHIFLMDEAAPIRVDMVEKDPDAFTKLLALRRHLMKSHVCSLFTDADDLATKAERTLREARQRMQK